MALAVGPLVLAALPGFLVLPLLPAAAVLYPPVGLLVVATTFLQCVPVTAPDTGASLAGMGISWEVAAKVTWRPGERMGWGPANCSSSLSERRHFAEPSAVSSTAGSAGISTASFAYCCFPLLLCGPCSCCPTRVTPRLNEPVLGLMKNTSLL